MAKARIFDLPETKGVFQIKGIVTGVEENSFYKETRTRNSKEMRIINFGVEYDKGKTFYINMLGSEREYVYFFKRGKKKGEKSDTVKVAWADRHTYKREGYNLIGKNIGLKKKADSEGKTVNDKKIMTEFDACEEVKDNLKDGMSVFIRGSLDCGSFIDDNNNKRVSTKLVPSQISLCSDIDFDDDNFKRQSDFNQVIIFMGIDREKDDAGKETDRFVVTAKIVTYKTIEDVEFIVEDIKLANIFKKNLQPYNAVKVSGHMAASIQTEDVEDDDSWGEKDAMEKIKAPVKREFIITGAKKSTVEKEVYTREKIEEAMVKIARASKADSDFGDDGWGDAEDIDDDDLPF